MSDRLALALADLVDASAPRSSLRPAPTPEHLSGSERRRRGGGLRRGPFALYAEIGAGRLRSSRWPASARAGLRHRWAGGPEPTPPDRETHEKGRARTTRRDPCEEDAMPSRSRS
jgi:hypothetical protein